MTSHTHSEEEKDMDHSGLTASILTAQTDKPAASDEGREAIWKVVHEVWQLLDDAETDSAGITTPDQQRWHAVSEAMDELEALVPDSVGPFWGGYPVNYFWPKPTNSSPDLFAVLLRLAKAVTPLVATPPIVGPVTQGVRDALNAANAALAKASPLPGERG